VVVASAEVVEPEVAVAQEEAELSLCLRRKLRKGGAGGT